MDYFRSTPLLLIRLKYRNVKLDYFKHINKQKNDYNLYDSLLWKIFRNNQKKSLSFSSMKMSL